MVERIMRRLVNSLVWPVRLGQLGDGCLRHYLLSALPASLWVRSTALQRLLGVRLTWEPDRIRVDLPPSDVLYGPLSRGERTDSSAIMGVFGLYWLTVTLLDEYEARRFLEPGMTVLDVGANIGSFSLLASRLVGARGRVIGIEPVPDNANCLRAAVHANDLANVRVVERAAGEREGALRIHLHPGSASHSAVTDWGHGVVEVRQSPIDELVQQVRPSSVDFLKLDVEGYELPALRGACETIRRFRPIIAAAAYHTPGDPQRIPELIEDIADDYEIGVRQCPPLGGLKCFAVPCEKLTDLGR